MIIDGIVLAVLLISAFISFLRGLIRETLTILGVVGGAAASWYGGPYLSAPVRGWLGVKEGETPARLFDLISYTIIADILSYGLIFIVVVAVLSVISHFISASVRAIGLGAVDRTLGVGFGLARGILLLGIFYLPFHIMLDDATKKNWFADSRTQVYLQATAGWMSGLVPENTLKGFKAQAQEVAQDPAIQTGIEAIKNPPAEDALRSQPPSSNNGETAGPGYDVGLRGAIDRLMMEGMPPQPEPKTPEPKAPPSAPQEAAP